MQNPAENSPLTPRNATPNQVPHTPQYGEFGKAEPVAGQEHSLTEGGQAAPSIAFPEQRGSTPQNLDSEAVRDAADDEYLEQREGWAKDDPRYGGGTRNWATNEPANHTTAPASEEREERNPNVGNNDNPDEFSALREDEGKGIPGAGKDDVNAEA